MRNNSEFQAMYIPADDPDLTQFIAEFLEKNPELAFKHEDIDHWENLLPIRTPIDVSFKEVVSWPAIEKMHSIAFDRISQTLESDSLVSEPEQAQDSSL